MTVKTLRFLGWVVGLRLIAMGIGRVLFSTDTIPGSGAVNPTVDSEIRATGVLVIALGVAYVWAVRTLPIPSVLLRFLAMTMALIALARVISVVDRGEPHWLFVASIAVEAVIAALTYWYSTMRDSASSPR